MRYPSSSTTLLRHENSLAAPGAGPPERGETAMKGRIVWLAIGLAALAAPALEAAIGAIDEVPAATLLLPYFEVDLRDPYWNTTLFSINNASAAPAIAHVTLWTDLSVPTLDFNVYLTGYDVQTINLRDVFDTGTVPVTSDLSPVGVFSLDSNPVSGVGPGAPGCDDGLPEGALPAILLDHIRAAHTGQPSPVVFGGLCSGVDYGDNVARGYITVDNVNSCSREFPGTAGYFVAGGAGAGANNVNQLWGDYFFVNSTHNFAQGLSLVHLEASNALGAGNYTFYRRYDPAGADQREGLASTFAVRYAAGPPFSDTDLLVWRDAKRPIAPFLCGTTPPPFPLSEDQIVIFDEAENPDVPETSPFSPPLPGVSLLPFPWESNRTRVNGTSLPVPYSFGWLYLNLNSTVAGSQVPFEPVTQNWVSVLMEAAGRFSVGYDGMAFDNVTDPAEVGDVLLPICDGDPDPTACG
jgi:hypothetical protein